MFTNDYQYLHAIDFKLLKSLIFLFFAQIDPNIRISIPTRIHQISAPTRTSAYKPGSFRVQIKFHITGTVGLPEFLSFSKVEEGIEEWGRLWLYSLKKYGNSSVWSAWKEFLRFKGFGWLQRKGNRNSGGRKSFWRFVGNPKPDCRTFTVSRRIGNPKIVLPATTFPSQKEIG